MTAEKGAEKTHTRRARDVARDGSIGCSCEREQLQQIFKAQTEPNSIQGREWVSDFQREKT